MPPQAVFGYPLFPPPLLFFCLPYSDTELDGDILRHLQDRVPGDQLQDWVRWCKERIKPAAIYMAGQETKHEEAIRIAKAAALWLPWRFVELNLLRAAVRERLQRFGLFSAEHVEQCLKEMDDYRALAADVADNTDLLQFWRSHADKLPAWHEAFLIVGLIQPSSAAAERGFSVFEFLVGRGNLPQATEELMETQMKAKMNLD